MKGRSSRWARCPGRKKFARSATGCDGESRYCRVFDGVAGPGVPRFAELIEVASGIAATPISNNPGEFPIWFRPEAHSGPSPGAATRLSRFVIGDDPSDLSPRRSFAQWHQSWKARPSRGRLADLAAARLIGQSVADFVLQFRAAAP